MSLFDGLSIGIVRDVDDPTGQGLIQVDLPTLPGRSRTAWAMVAAPMAGKDRGLCFMPELEDQAIVGFLSDAPDQPVILGYTWNGVDKPPTAHPRQRIIRSLNGHTIRMVDGPKGKDGAGELVIEDANGNKVILSNGKIRLDAVAVIEINAPHVTISGPGWSRVISPINNKPI
jgi:Type VI secretion system/phage-baseplate injector OB domain